MKRILLTAVFIAFLGLLVSADEPYQPQIAQASKDAELAIEGFVIPDGMSGSLLAAEPQLANPVAFHISRDGKVYVCETFRQEVGVEDNRSHMNWLHNDLRLQTVEERLAMFRRYLGNDVTQYGTQHDRIRLLSDSNGDGRLDAASVFAQGFNDILAGTGAGVLEHNGKVFYTCIPKLWLLEDTDSDGVADQREYLHHGYGVRVAFRGHDMHGLVMGPDGRLYFSIGDRGYNVITREGQRLHRPDCGAVFRCDLDGSHLEVFAYGLRNPQELAFDDQGNLFTVDNNSDSGDQARLTYIVQDSDTGWRMYYQYLDDRGPWNRERMWYPYRADDETAAVQPAYIVPPIVNVSDGPSGFTFYPGLGLSDRYKDHFFLADFRGTAGNSGIRSFAVKPLGATFEITDSHQFIWSILATDVDFAPDGSMYVSDWVNGWVGEGKGRLYRFADDQNISAVSGANVAETLRNGLAESSTSELLELLNHADRRIRQLAQFELAERNETSVLLTAAEQQSDETRQRHIAWALWQIGLRSPDAAKQVCQNAAALMKHSNETAVQYLRIVTDLVRRHGLSLLSDADVRDNLRKALAGFTTCDNLRTAGFAAVALGQTGQADDALLLVNLLDRNNGNDPVVRHQAAVALARLTERAPGLAAGFSDHQNPAVRTAIVLANARCKDTQALIAMLQDRDSDVVLEAVRALMDEQSGVAEAEVFALWNRPSLPDALARRCLEAGYRLGTVQCAAVVASIASDANRNDSLRTMAVEMLLSWNEPQPTDTVNGRWRELSQREIPGLDNAIRSHLPGMLAGPKKVSDTAVKVAAQLGIRDVVPTLQKMLADMDTSETSRVAAFRALASLTDNVESLLAKGQMDASEAVRVASLELLAERNPESAVAPLASVVQSGSVRSRQTALRLLGQIPTSPSTKVLVEAFQQLQAGSLPPAITLDLLNAAEQRKDDQLHQLVADFRMDQKSVGTRLAEWSECLEGGDAAQGETIFFGRAAASCRRCHKVNGNGADVGPDLSAVAKDKDRSYLLEAIVDPNAKIAKGFETTIIVDIDGRIHSGIIREETDQLVRLMTPKGALITVSKEDIDERAKGQSGMPADITKGLTRSEVRDLVEYLTTLTAAKDSSHGKGGE